MFGIGTRVSAPFKGETLTGVVVLEAFDHKTGEHVLNIRTDAPRFSPITGRRYYSTRVDGKKAERI